VTEALTILAEGRTDVEVQYAIATTKIGAIARTIGVFKNNRIERRQLEAERMSAEKLAIDQRKAELKNQFVENFRAKISGTIERGAAFLGTIRKGCTAALRNGTVQTAEMSGQSADASAQASEHVRSAAAASNELSQSIVENQPPGQ